MVDKDTNIPIIASAPVEIPKRSRYLCFYSSPVGKNLEHAFSTFSIVKDRLLSFKNHPASPDEFDNAKFLSCETVAHATRLLACFEKNYEKRANLFEYAYNIYEGLILSSCRPALIDILKQIGKGPSKAIHFHTLHNIHKLNPDLLRMHSHSFAGMALCVFHGCRDQKKFVSLVSASMCCSRRPLELSSTLRLIPFIVQRCEYYITENLLIPAMLEAGRRDLFDTEIGFVEPENRASCAEFAMTVVQYAIDRETARVVPHDVSTALGIKTRIVNGKMIDRKCANCGEWDRTGKSYRRCSVCMQVYYCSKECQAEQWKEHKISCKKCIE